MVKIVAIEDETKILNYVCEALELNDYETFGANNGRVGLELIYEHSPDIVISDILMPELDGYEVLKTIRQDEKYKYMPFIFLTSKTSTEAVERGLELGASTYITKPFTIGELLHVIETLLEP